jgi:hypothetical protein
LPSNSSLAEYDLDTEVQNRSEWEKLLLLGDSLLEAVREFYKKLGASFFLVVLMLTVANVAIIVEMPSNSLLLPWCRWDCAQAGRYALWTTRDDNNHLTSQMVIRARNKAPFYNQILEILSGLIFIGTPHNIEGFDESLDVLRACLNLSSSKQKKKMGAIDVTLLNTISKEFSLMKTQNLPVLSLYEEPTRGKWYRFDLRLSTPVSFTETGCQYTESILISLKPSTETRFRVGWRNEELHAFEKEPMRNPASSKKMTRAVAKLFEDAVRTSENRIKEVRSLSGSECAWHTNTKEQCANSYQDLDARTHKT